MYNKYCDYCDSNYEAKGPAGKYCGSCLKLNKYVKVQRGISHNLIKGSYLVIFSRESSGYLREFTSSLIEAQTILANWGLAYSKEPNTGLNNNACRAGIVCKQHNFRQKRLEIKAKSTFRCNRCTKVHSKYSLNLHHIDHNRDNDEESNFEVLCTYCHREHHNNRDAEGRFISQGSTTIPRGSTLQVKGSGSGVNDNKSL